MLKITYTENSFYLEYLTESVATWMARRTLVCLRAAVSIHVESSAACVIVPNDTAYLSDLEKLPADRAVIEITPCDDEYIEVCLQGTWVTSHKDSEEGIFVCDLNDCTESSLYKLWQESQAKTSVMSE